MTIISDKESQQQHLKKTISFIFEQYMGQCEFFGVGFQM